MHKVGRAGDLRPIPHPKFASHATGLTWAPFVDHADETVHMAYGRAALAPGGESEIAVHAYEKALFVTAGRLEVMRQGRVMSLGEGDHVLVPTGVEHALRNLGDTAAEWVEMAAPQPKPSDGWTDTWFAGSATWPCQASAPDLRDRRNRMLGHYEYAQQPPSAKVHPDLDGFSLRMLMDSDFGAVHFNMFVVSFADGGICNHHDHPFEEGYVILGGAVDITFDGQDYTLEAGDFAWTGVGSRHAFFPKPGRPVHWLEVQAPQPPAAGGMRWHSQWEYMSTILRF